MPKVKFEIKVEESEVCDAVDMIKEIIEVFGFPEYKIDTEKETVEAPARAFPLCGTEVRDTEPAPEGFPYPSTGDLVEINGYELVVFASDLNGELVLIPRTDLIDDDE